VLEIADRITVFRDGRLVADLPRQGTTKNDLVGLMLGEAKHAKIFADTAQTRATAGEVGKAGVVLQVIDVAIAGVLGPISLEVRTGEILGIGGLVGSGRTELLRCIAGAEPTATGTIVLDGRRHGWPTTVRRARDHGIVLIPEDRKREGVVPLLTAAENIGLAGLARLCRSFVVSPRLIARSAAEMGTRFGFDARRLHSAAGKLSGGNQQKLLLARAASTSPRVLLADEPTRGIDVGAKAEIMDALRQLALEGCAVIVVSSELEEVVAISNRVVVLHEGRKAGEVDGATTPISVAGILNMAFGIATGEAAAKPDHGSRASARAEQHRRSA
jgi:rhamnose transport system ATP-binding protein